MAKKQNRNNIITNSIKTLKMVHFKKKILKINKNPSIDPPSSEDKFQILENARNRFDFCPLFRI